MTRKTRRNNNGKTLPISFRFIFIALFLLLMSNLHGQELIAVHPLHTQPESAEMAAIYYDLVLREIPRLQNQNYNVYAIDLNNLPPDVPPGGFAPWITPSPSITRGAPYALTGEASRDPEFPGHFRIRVYLWRMADNRLLGSDEMIISGRADAQQRIPGFLEWVLSWIHHEITSEPIIIYVDGEPRIVETFIYDHEIPQEYWLYLGLRAGIGSGSWAHSNEDNSISTRSVTSLLSANAAFQAEFRLSRFFSIQAEANFLYDFGSVNNGSGETSYSSMSLQFPLLAKVSLRGENMSASLFGGAYYHLPLSQSSDEDWAIDTFNYEPGFPGITFGLSVSTRLGPGYIFIDTRYEMDGLWDDTPDTGRIDHRNTLRFNVGYKMGFFARNRREVEPVSSYYEYEDEYEEDE